MHKNSRQSQICLLSLGLFLSSILALKAENTPLFWRVTSPTTSVFLLGSIHDATDAVYPLPEHVLRAYTNSQKLVFEVDLDSLSDPLLVFQVLDCIYYPVGDCLEDHISADLFQKVSLFARQHNLELQTSVFCKRPWFLAAEATLAQLEPIGYKTGNAVDAYLFERAKRDGKTREALETAEEQFRLLCDKPEAGQIRDLETAITKPQEIREAASHLESIWLGGDEEGLTQIVEGSAEEDPDYIEKLIFERSAKWLPSIQTLLQGDETAFVVVGASHLVGSRGLIALLRGTGASVEKIPARPRLLIGSVGTNIRIQAACDGSSSYSLEGSEDLSSWRMLSRHTCAELTSGIELPKSSGKAQFFRLR